MSAPFAWDESAGVVVPPALVKNDVEHRRQIRDFAVNVALRAGQTMFRPFVGVASSYVYYGSSGALVGSDNAWIRLANFTTEVGDPLFDMSGQQYPTTLRVDAATQKRFALCLALLEVTTTAGLTIDLGIGPTSSNPGRMWTRKIVAAASTERIALSLPRLEMASALSAWVRSSNVGATTINADTWFAAEIGYRWLR